MADDILTDEWAACSYHDPFVVEVGDGRQWLNMRNAGGIERAIREHNRVAAELRAARTRLAACRSVLNEIEAAQAEIARQGIVAPFLSELDDAISASLRAALGVDGD